MPVERLSGIPEWH